MRVSPDPDGAGTLKFRAQRLIYDADGNVSKLEAGTTTTLTGAFTPAASGERVEIAYDALGRKSKQSLVSGTFTPTTHAVTQYSYDTKGRLSCTAVRMNPAVFGSPSAPSDACALGAEGTAGPDRITKSIYDNADEATQVQVAVGTSDAATERTLTYTSNGKLQTLKDAENNLTTYEYDGFDRLSKTFFPVTTKGANQSNAADYEQLGYDTNSNVTSRRSRDGTSTSFTFDNLNRVTLKDLPGAEPDVTFAYDNLGRLTSASQTGSALSFTYDAFGRNLTQTGPQGTVTSQWDVAGRRTQITYPGTGLFVNYDYLVTGEVQKIRENGAVSGVGVLAAYAYDDQGRRTSLTFGNGAVQSYTYDAVSRLASLTNDLSGTANDLTIGTFAYNPAAQITGRPLSSDSYTWTVPGSTTESGTPNGLNQQTAYAAKSLSHDARGNVIAYGTKSFTYSSENLLLTGPNGTTLSYDPLARLQQVSGAQVTQFAWDGSNIAAEFDASNALLRRYVYGPGNGPIVWYDGTGTTDRRFLSADERGSIVSVTDSAGTLLGINKYDEFGQPQATNIGRFGYTGQAYLSDIGVWYYRARMYDPELGRFMQSDPIGFRGGPNLYAYVLNDPINLVDPIGLNPDDIIITARRRSQDAIIITAPRPPFVFGGAIGRITVALPSLPPILGGNGGLPGHGGDDDDDTCNIGSINLNLLGDLLNVTGNISFPQGQSTPNLGAINSAWTGQFGRYSVVTDMTEGGGGLVGHIVGPKHLPESDFGRNMYLNTLVGATEDQRAYRLWAAGHEFGHKLGLPDQYFLDPQNPGVGIPFPGHSSDIMGAYGGAPTESEISAILSNCS
jgi:RHS repeat-associated protein